MKTLHESILAGRKSNIEKSKEAALEECYNNLRQFLISGLNPLFQAPFREADYIIGSDNKGIYVDVDCKQYRVFTFNGCLDLSYIGVVLHNKIIRWNEIHKDKQIDFDFRLRNCNAHVIFDNCQNLTSLEGFYETVESLAITGFVGGRSHELDLHGITIKGSKHLRDIFFKTDCDLTIKGPLNYKGFIDHSMYSNGVRHKLNLVNIKNVVREI